MGRISTSEVSGWARGVVTCCKSTTKILRAMAEVIFSLPFGSLEAVE